MLLLKEKMKIILTKAMYIVEDAKKLTIGIVPKKETFNMMVQWKNDDQLETYLYY
jgi:hypothetical protein